MDNTQNKNKKFIAWVFLVVSILIDIFVISHTASRGIVNFAIIVIAALFALAVKTRAILVGYYRYNNWQYDYKKIKAARRWTILIMIIVDIVLIIIAGLVSGYNETHNDYLGGATITTKTSIESQNSVDHQTTRAGKTPINSITRTTPYREGPLQIMGTLTIICIFLTAPAIIISLIISSQELKNIQNKTSNREGNLFNPAAIKFNSANNSTKAITAKKIIAWSFLVVSLLVDIVTAFIGIVPWIGYGMMTLMIVDFCAIPFSIIKVLAILMGYYCHDDWQYDYKKITSYKMRTALLIIIVDIVSIVIAGIISNFGVKWCGSGGCELVYGKGLEIVKEVALAIGFSSIPALFASLVIGAINKKK